MGAERGSAFLLKIGDGAEPPAFATVAGLKTTQLAVNGDPVAITNKDSGGWRELLTGAGVRSGPQRHDGRRNRRRCAGRIARGVEASPQRLFGEIGAIGVQTAIGQGVHDGLTGSANGRAR